jgi:hypothetical protein
MATIPTVKLTILFTDRDLDEEEKEAEVQRLLTQMKQLDEIERVDRVHDANPPEGNKALGGFLVGLLSAEVSPANLKKLFGFLGDRLSGKTIELEVEANGRKLKVKASSREELIAEIAAAQEFVTG